MTVVQTDAISDQLRETAGASRPSPRSIVSRISAVALSAPTHLAVVDGSSRITFADLERRSNQLARFLVATGAKPETCVALFFDRSIDFVIAALGVLKSGAAYLPIDASTPSERTAFILGDAGAQLVLTHAPEAGALPAGSWRTIQTDGPDAARIAACGSTPLDSTSADDSLAYVIYTSGSTGQPKGVEITNANLRNLVDWHIQAFEVTGADRASHVAGLGFDAAGWEIWPHLAAGATLFIADEITRRSAHALRDWLLAQQITISFAPTVLAEQLLYSTWPADTSLRILLTGADTLHRRPAEGLPFTLINNYGPTECTVVTTSGKVSPGSSSDGAPSIGKPICNATVFVLDAALKPVPAGEPGELCVAGALLGRGYRNRPELTASRFVTYQPEHGAAVRVYRTGDRVRVLANGELAFLGRLDDQVKIRGYRIELGEIAAAMDKHLRIEASAVVVREAPEGPMLVAYLVPARDSRLTSSELREFLAPRLPDYMIPSQFVAVDTLPVTANGKLDKAALPAPTAATLLPGNTQASSAAAVRPAPAGRTTAEELETRIASMVASLLGQPAIHRDDNFFMVGGHSMLGAQLVARIKDTFNVRLSLRQLFTAPTVAALSAEVFRLTEAAAGGAAGK